ncbi:MAG: hypothetical protein ABJF50_00185 [Paracoccaceae bacterium]
MDFAQAIVMFIQLWGVIGAVVALPFLVFGIDRIDEDARDAYVFRPLLIPGILMIWPLVLWRWWQIESESSAWMSRYRVVRKAHGIAAMLMATVVVVAIIFGLSVRQTWPADFAPQQISEAGQ